MLAELGHELWMGDAARIRAAVVRRQKMDSNDADYLLGLLLSDRFPRIWVPSPREQDVRELLRHRYKLVVFRSSVRNQLLALAMGQGLCRRNKLWTVAARQGLEGLAMGGWASRRKQELLKMLDQLNREGSRDSRRGADSRVETT
jgi:transposase